MIVTACLLGAALCGSPVFGQAAPSSRAGSTPVPSEVVFPLGLPESADAERSRPLATTSQRVRTTGDTGFCRGGVRGRPSRRVNGWNKNTASVASSVAYLT